VLVNANCGTIEDACSGDIVACGNCPRGEICVSNVCESCVPKTCAELEWQCGTGGDGCGGTLDCGTCPAYDEQGEATSMQCYEHGCCVPRACPDGACGEIADGCGGTVQCGVCPDTSSGMPQVCGLVSANVCTPCTPRTCDDLGWLCGTGDDGCGRPLECGGCPDGEYCSVPGQAAHVCTPCTPKTACEPGECGEISDGCGGSLTCGGCTAGQVCGHITANVCDVCTPAECPSGLQCGTTSDGCGGEADCGECPDGFTCVDNQCCNPKTCGDPGVGCDTTDDGCGGPLDCSCTNPLVCDASGSCCAPIRCIDVCNAGPYDGPDGCGRTLHCESCQTVE
jgi:hypothetical protein